MEDSILDKVISSKQSQELREFNPPETVAALLKQLTDKEEDILRRRYGLNGKHKQTLEEIGKFYNLTRERIRQVESTAIKKLKALKNFSDLIEGIDHTIKSVLEQNGGAISKEHLVEQLFEFTTDTPVSRQSVTFIISKLLSDRFLNQPATSYFRSSWRLPSVSIDSIRKVIDNMIVIISEKNHPMTEQEITKAYWQRYPNDGANVDSSLDDHALIGYITMSQKIDRNPFNDYGLTGWGTIVPRRMNDKIYLVLKKEGKPMHFIKIAERINKINFDKRRAYPPTVHNELILNDRYVLVGRGIYALKEWGYKPGVVADVITQILKKNGEPMKRKDIVEEVLGQRMVKNNTIHLALTDTSKFKRLPDGRYGLVDEAIVETSDSAKTNT
ncbi:hypothetical protein KKG41_04420 [Patescibacteria group bacterium]|nr:hypothetical protein [Patescibacteria group bacterium]MBU1889923.1 hypothetical protein [Patescibacteria group bacterium]